MIVERRSWRFWWRRGDGVVGGGGGVGVKLVVGKKWRQKLQKLTCALTLAGGVRKSRDQKCQIWKNSKSKHLFKKNSSQKEKNTKNKTPSDILSTYL